VARTRMREGCGLRTCQPTLQPRFLVTGLTDEFHPSGERVPLRLAASLVVLIAPAREFR